MKEHNSIFSNIKFNTFLFKNYLNFKTKILNNEKITDTNINYSNNIKINSFLFNLEVKKHFKISEDLLLFYKKTILGNYPHTEITNITSNINYLHVLLFEIYSEILTDIFLFTLFINIINIYLKENPILKDLIMINATNFDFISLSKLSFLFKKIKQFINERDNNLHNNLEKIIIMIIEEI